MRGSENLHGLSALGYWSKRGYCIEFSDLGRPDRKAQTFNRRGRKEKPQSTQSKHVEPQQELQKTQQRSVQVGHRAGTGTARVTAAPTRASIGRRGRALLSGDSKDRELGRQRFAFALGAGWFLAAEYDGFELMATLLADVLEDRHNYYRIYETAVELLQF